MGTKCTYCYGHGTVTEQVQWSDGLGAVDAQCPLCNGTKEQPASLAAEIIRDRSDK
jgi:DnaJ-class molecular chaperone